MQNQSKSFPRLPCAENYLFNKSCFQMQILQLPVSSGWPCGRSPWGLVKAVLCSPRPPQHLQAPSWSCASGPAAPPGHGAAEGRLSPCLVATASFTLALTGQCWPGVCTNVRTLHLVEPYSHTGFILIKSQNPIIIPPARPKGTV